MNINNLIFSKLDLETTHNLPEDDFLPYVGQFYPNVQILPTTDNRQLIYINNDAPILGIAHLDGTMPPSHFAYGRHRFMPDAKCIFSPMVDDRLGAFTLLHLLPQIEANVDILLSVGEEIGNPTSQFFWPHKRYNWMFQFDRMGTGAVHYQYQKPSWLWAIEQHFGRPTQGTFSDISFMEHLDIQGVNIGTAYYDYTSTHAWANLHELTDQVYRFKTFYDSYHGIKF